MELSLTRLTSLTSMAGELDKENYHGKNHIRKREQEILKRWEELLDLVERHRVALQAASQLMSVMRELDTVASTIRDIKVGTSPSQFLIASMLTDGLLRLFKGKLPVRRCRSSFVGH